MKDFPAEAAEPYGIEILHPDTFLLRLLHQHPTEVIDALESGTQDLHRPPETLVGWLAGLTAVVPIFANLAADELDDPVGPVTKILGE